MNIGTQNGGLRLSRKEKLNVLYIFIAVAIFSPDFLYRVNQDYLYILPNNNQEQK